MKRIVSWMILLTVCWALPGAVLAAEPVGSVTFVKGAADITRPGQAAQPLVKGEDIYVEDIVRTKTNAKVEITFIDDSIVRVAQRSRLQITEYMFEHEERRSTLSLFRGKIQSLVKKVAGFSFGRARKNRFEIHTPTAVCGVRGTDFFTWFMNGQTGTAFKEGQGYIYPANNPALFQNIDTNQAGYVDDPNAAPVVRPATDADLEQHLEETVPTEGEDDGDGGDDPGAGLTMDGGDPGDTDGTGDGALEAGNPVFGSADGGSWYAESDSVSTLYPDVEEQYKTGISGATLAMRNIGVGAVAGSFAGDAFSRFGGDILPDSQVFFLTHGTEGDLPWGLYNIKLGAGGMYTRRPEGNAAWSGMIAGGDAFFDDGSGDGGMFIAGANGTWNDAGEIVGKVGNESTEGIGKYMTAYQIGGAFMETGKFLAMVQENPGYLDQLLIPRFEVGRTDLSWADSAGERLTSVNMNDVVFLSHSTGASPSIWATQNVSGTYNNLPVGGVEPDSVSLSGPGFSNVAFTVNNFGTVESPNNWGALIDGAGTVPGTTHNVQINGGAAGTFGGGAFNGTGAGVAKPAMAE